MEASARTKSAARDVIPAHQGEESIQHAAAGAGGAIVAGVSSPDLTMPFVFRTLDRDSMPSRCVPDCLWCNEHLDGEETR